MKDLRWMTALILAILMAVMTPMQTLAAGQTKYISDISIGYGDNGKTALEKEGYTVWQDINANEGGNGSAVWIGYKTTTDESEAITDVALMNMKGGYSFDAYTKEIEDLNHRVSEQLAGFRAAIEEFRRNYEDGNPFALEACKIMNSFTDDESDDRCIGELFLDESTSDETLHRIFLEGNSEAIGAIEQALAVACIEIGGENVLTRIEESEYSDRLSSEKNASRTAIASVFDDFHSAAVSLLTLADEIEENGGEEEFFARETLSDDEKLLYTVQYSKYILLSETSFGDTGMSLLDFALLDKETENEDGEVLEDEYIEMLAKSMTDGQLGIVANVGIMTILVDATAAEKADEYEIDTEDVGTVSVYYGVDRGLFEDMDGIALTSAALREKAAAEGNDFGKDANANALDEDTLHSIGVLAIIAGSIALLYGAASIWITAQTTLGETLDFWLNGVGTLAELHAAASAPLISVSGIIFAALGVIAIIAGIVLLCFEVTKWIEKPTEPENINYTEIPRVIVEKPDGQKSFIAYYAAKLAGATDNETDSTKLYGDLNGLNGKDEWVVLYYTKNKGVGVPITTEMLVSNTGVLKASEADKYTAVHMFGEKSAANLNQYNTGKDVKNIYMFLRTDSSALRQSGTIFTQDSVLMNLATFVIGAGLASVVTYYAVRKKKAKA